jgi:2-polyprenyl-3-methyl-5-hydroxy-6-metoxy-1,4-benzoquinol methylase
VSQKTTELPAQLAERIWKEAEENDAIYRRRSLNDLDLSKLHYGHAKMLEWAFQQLGNLKGARVLDIGVGEGQSSVLLARAGAQVTAIEVSGGALERAEELAKRCGVQIDFRQMPGEDLRFEDASFDGILCISAYHHMDQGRAASEFARVLQPGGRAVFIEPLASNPPAWLYRRIGRFLSREATSEEMPLRIRDLRFLRQHFRKVKWEGMYLLSLGLFSLDRIWNNANRAVEAITKRAFRLSYPVDSALLRIPGLSRVAWKIRIVAER